MFKNLVTICVILITTEYKSSDAIFQKTHTTQTQDTKREFSARQMGRSLAQCFGQDKIMNCLESEFLETLDSAIQNNETWQFSDYIALEKTDRATTAEDNEKLRILAKQQRSLGDSMAIKLLQLAQSRSLKLQLPTAVTSLLATNERGISSGLGDFTTSIEEDTTTVAGTTVLQEEGRKKKYKDKNMAMMGGMAMMAMVAQMFLGKVILIAGAAFVMAKIALLVSVLGSLKKGSSGSSGSTEHVIVTGGGGGGGGGGHSHEHSSGWHRSMPLQYNPSAERPIAYYETSENEEEFKRRQTPIQGI